MLVGAVALVAVHAEPFTAVSIPDLSSTGLEALAARFLDSGATLSVIPTLTGMNGQLATFTNFATNFGAGQPGDFAIASGVILSTGHGAAAADTYFGGSSTSYDNPGDARLTAMAGYDTFDAVSFLFTFQTSLPTFSLNYAFASAEYPDAVNTQSNDIMAIYLNGANIAVLPSGAAVSVNSINSGSNSSYYLRDSTFGATPFAYGGITTLLTASGAVNPGVNNTLEIVIADGGDHIFDSAVLLQDWHGVTPGPRPGPEPTVPEPSTWAMLVAALTYFFALSRKRTGSYIQPITPLQVTVVTQSTSGSALKGTILSIVSLTSLSMLAHADSRSLMVPVYTRVIANDGSNPSDYSIIVGNNQYYPPSNAALSGFQVLFLSRQDLSLVDNQYVDGTSTTDVGRLENPPNCGVLGCLVIIQSLRTIGPVSNDTCNTLECNLFLVLEGDYGAKIQLVNYANLSDPNTGYSMINTMINLNPGHAYERLSCLPNGQNDCYSVLQAGDKGSIHGNFILDNLGGYTFSYPGRVPYSTGTGGSPYRNAMVIGQNLGNLDTKRGTYRSASITNRSGFHILVLARDTLFPISNNTYSFDPSDLTGLVNATATLNQVANSSRLMVMLASIGDLSGYTNTGPWIAFGAALEAVGGTFHVLNQCQTGDDYSLVGWGGATILTGAVEASTVISRATRLSAPPSNIRGVLKQDHFGNHTPAYSSLGSSFTQSTINMLDAIAFQPKTDWPAWTVAQLDAYTALSKSVSGNPDVRSLYTDQSQDPGKWLSSAQNAVYSKNPYYLETDFNVVKSQLIQEFTGLVGIYTFRSNLIQFYSDVQISQSGELDQAYTAVKNSLSPPPDTGVPSLWQSVFGDSGNIVSAVVGLAVPEAYVALDIAFTVADTAMEYAKTDDGTSVTTFESTFANLQKDWTRVFNANQDTLLRLFDLITTDWGRIQRLGIPLANGKIDFGTDTRIMARQALNRSLRQKYFTALIPSTYDMAHWRLVGWGAPATLEQLCHNIKKDPCHLDNSDPENWVTIANTYFTDGQSWSIWKIGQGTDAICQASNDGTLLSPLFAPISATGDPSQLGIYKPYFFMYLTQPIVTYTDWTPTHGGCQ